MRRSIPMLAAVLALPLAVPAPAGAGCLECDAIYATGCNFELWRIDPVTLQATQLGGPTPEFMFDLAATADGRLFALGVSGALFEVDPCSGATVPAPGAPGGNGLGGDPALAALYGQGPPLTLTDVASGVTAVVGGMIGAGPGDWCGASTGDLAFQPGTATIFSTIACFGGGCNGDTLINVDPASGTVTATVGCTRDAGGNGFPDVHGLAFDSKGTLWGALGADVRPDLLQIDPASGLVTTVGVTGGYVCGTGLAILPCPATPAVCAPLTQGFWKRVCAGPHPSGEHEKLPSYPPCVAARATFKGVASAAEICDRLVPSPPNVKCEQAEAQLMAAALNVCSGRLDPGCCIASGNTAAVTAGAAIAEADALLASPGRTFSDCVRAQAIAAEINEGAVLCRKTRLATGGSSGRTRLAPARRAE